MTRPRPSLSILLLAASFLASSADALALTNPPPAARPIIVGTSDYCNVLFGKLQRAASLWGTNLGQPQTIVCPGDKDGKLNKCLWNQFYMASTGSDGTLSLRDLLEPLNSWSGNDLKDTLLFLDAVTPKEKSMLASLPFLNKNADDNNESPSIDPAILQVAAERGCAHIYALASPETLSFVYNALEPYSSYVPSTIVALEQGVAMMPTPGWTTCRPQNMEGEFVGPIALVPYDNDAYYNNYMGNSMVPVEDVVEVMMQLALRTDRTFKEYPRVVALGPASANPNSYSTMAERPNADYFTLTGGPKAREQAGTVLSVASWEAFLSPLGQVNADLGRREDQM